MSMLVGVRGSSRENEGQPIIQQPGSFFNGNPSSYIWSNTNPPTPPTWRDSSLTNGSSSSSSSSFASTSSFPTPGTRMEKQWQYEQVQQILEETASGEEELNETGTIRRAEKFKFRQDRPSEQSFNMAGTASSHSLDSYFSFGFPAPSTSSIHVQGWSKGLDPFQFSSTQVHEKDRSHGKQPVGKERGISEGFVGANANVNNHQTSPSGLPDSGFVFHTAYNIRNLTSDLERGLRLHSAQPSFSHTQTTSQSPSNFVSRPMTSTGNSFCSEGGGQPSSNIGSMNMAYEFSTSAQSASEVSDCACVNPATVRLNGLQPLTSQKEDQGVFVFGASAASGSGSRSGASQQKSLPSSVTGPALRSRTAKVKKHSNSVKGKGPAAVTGIVVGRMASELMDSAPFSTVGTSSPAEVSDHDSNECSGYTDAGDPDVGNADLKFGSIGSLHPAHRSKPEVSLDPGGEKLNVQFCWQHQTYEQRIFENQHLDIKGRFDSWHPFEGNTVEGYNKGSEQTKAQVCPSSESGVLDDSTSGGLPDEFLSEANMADLLERIHSCGEPLGDQGKTGRRTDADVRFGTWMAGSESATNASTLANDLPTQNEVAAAGSEFLDDWKFGLNSSGKPFVQDRKDDMKCEALRQEFAKMGNLDASPDVQKKDHEPTSNSGSKGAQHEQPFVFRASRSCSGRSSTSSGQTELRTAFGVYNGSDIPLPSVSKKSVNVKADSVKNMGECSGRGIEGNLYRDNLHRSGDNWSTSSFYSCFNAANNDEAGFHDLSWGQSSVVSQPAASSSVPFIFQFKARQQSPSDEGHNEVPAGEFSAPLSSSESSASEGSPIRGEEAELSSNPSHSFEFRGSTKGMTTGIAMRKKKPRVSSNARKQGKYKGRMSSIAKGGLYSSFSNSAEGPGSPMDFSPHIQVEPEVEPALGDTFNEANLEQPSSNSENATVHSVESEADDKEGWEHTLEDPRVEELRAAAASLCIQNAQGDDPNNVEHKGTYVDGWHGSETLFQRNRKWKRSGFEGEQSASVGLENPWMNSQGNRVLDAETDRSHIMLNFEGGNQRRPNLFNASSPPTVSSSMLRRHSRRIQRERTAGIAAETVKHSSSHSQGDASPASVRADAPGTAGLGCVSQGITAAKHGLSHSSSVIVNEKGQVGVAKTAVVRTKEAFTLHKQSEDILSTKVTDSESVSGQGFDTGMPASPSAVKSAAAEQVCERWRLRGNQAYANGDFPRAEEYYSRGASSISPNETSQSCIRASMLCYSNRAATRMAVGRMREALADCMRAMVVDPNFLRVRLRAASCHLALGESKAAANMFKECLKHAKEGNKSDSKLAAEAMEGVKRTQQLDDYSDRALELLEKGNSVDSTAALRLLNEALLISPHSESLLEMKAKVLFSLRRHEEVIQLCEQSLSSAERNHGALVNDQQHQDSCVGEPCGGNGNSFLKLWRWRMSAKSLFHLGRLEESFTLLLKHEEEISVNPTDKSGSTDSLASLISNIRDLLRHKAAGNEAFQAGKHAEAVEHYTAALACNGESRPYNAVCFCNRAAASQALGHIADAIADCSRAIALDSNYPKAISRRATLHEMVRDYGQACNDLRRLISLLESSQQREKNTESSRVGGPNSNAQDLRQARDRLEKAEEEMKKGHPVDHYLIFGVDFSCSANEIKKAYRKAALKHHPDKAGQFLVRGESGDDGTVWKEVGDEVRRDAERLFKMIGEAYAILSDPAKRLRYDTEEELRKLRVKDGTGSMSGTSEVYRSQYEKGSRRQRDRWEAWNGFSPQYQRWQNGPDAAQPDTYARRSNYAANASKSSGGGSRSTDFYWDDV